MAATNFVAGGVGGYSSELEDEEQRQQEQKQKQRKDDETTFKKPSGAVPSKSSLREIAAREQAVFVSRNSLLGMNAYDRHKKFINDYVIHYGRQTAYLPKQKEKTDYDVLREEYRFIRTEEDNDDSTWEHRVAKRYYDKLFKEYCLADMTRYKEGKVGLRWRTQNEVFSGKGQFVCGNKKCNRTDHLKSYELNFAYVEAGEKKNALVKLRVCPECADMLNYKALKRQRKEQKKQEKKEKKRKLKHGSSKEDKEEEGEEEGASEEEKWEEKKEEGESKQDEEEQKQQPQATPALTKQELEAKMWGQKKPETEKSKEEEYEEYFQGMFL